MSTVSYLKQPAIHKTRGSVPLAGTEHLYTVNDILWPQAVEAWIAERLIGRSLHVCCGKSQLGDVRLDLFEARVDVRANAARLPFADSAFDTVLIDPPYSGVFQWNHDMLNELHRVARQRIIFQHWFIAANKNGEFKKAHVFKLSELAYVYDPSGSRGNSGLALAIYDPTQDQYLVAQEDITSDKVFRLGELVAWQGRTYFGRAQILQVYDRYDV